MQMIELYAYQVGPVKSGPEGALIWPPKALPASNAWDAAKKEYNERPERGRAFCTLPKHEQVEIVRKYVNREV